MDNSTAGVTLLNGFVFDVLNEYKAMKRTCAPVFDLAKDLDPSRPLEWCSIELYNEVCDWIERNIGPSSIRKAGVAIGSRVYDMIVHQGELKSPSPLTMLQALRHMANEVAIKDPKKRGWEILDTTNASVTMRRTQTFNCVLQEGLLVSLVERTGVAEPDVEHVRCTRRGDEFCDYKLTWL